MRSQETTNAVTAQDIVSLQEHVDRLERQVNGLVGDRDQALKWGIIALGTAVVGMATWIFNFVTGHLK